MRLPERQYEWQIGGWKLGVTACPGIWCLGIWWDGNPYSFSVTLPLMHLWCERDGGNYLRWEWTILRVVIGKQEVRTDLAFNDWSLGVVVHESDDWSMHIGPIDIECEYDKFYDIDDKWVGAAHVRLFSKAREQSPCQQRDSAPD